MELPKHDVLADGSKGPFLCGLCEYYREPNTCVQSYIKEHFNGHVGYDWCCDFFERDPKLGSTGSLLKRAMKKD